VLEHMTDHREALKACFRSEDHREGVASFLERRPAHFLGR
jgi:enoyl-CoA hydratase/carnithine racemase